jgi:hypothetical protein
VNRQILLVSWIKQELEVKMTKCIICNVNEATIPDRNEPWSNRKKVCQKCHSERLKNDFVDILEIERRRRECRK